MKRMTEISYGTDIEWFLKDQSSGEIITGEGIVKGTKEHPFELGDNGFMSSLDNVLIEGNIPPVTTKTQWLSAIDKLKHYLIDQVPNYVTLEAMADHIMGEKYLASEHARTFGCSISFLAWSGLCKENPPIEVIGNRRTAGFHVHVAWDGGESAKAQKLFIQFMDYHLGLPSVLLEPKNSRRPMYGVAGEYRSGLKYTGCEYRVLSSYFAGTPELQGWVFDHTQAAIEAFNEERTDFLDFGDDIQKAINTNDKELATALIQLGL